MTTLWIGIDPGLSGALGWQVGDSREHLGVIDTPTATTKGSRRDYLAAAMAEAVRELRFEESCAAAEVLNTQAVLEKVNAMPGGGTRTMGATSAFTFGRGTGLWEGILSGLGIPYVMVAPKDWKKALGIAAGSDKGASRVLAARLFPELVSNFGRVKDDGRAEAMLLVEYRRRLG